MLANVYHKIKFLVFKIKGKYVILQVHKHIVWLITHLNHFVVLMMEYLALNICKDGTWRMMEYQLVLKLELMEPIVTHMMDWHAIKIFKCQEWHAIEKLIMVVIGDRMVLLQS
jgi:hypothetical protein